MMKYYVIFDDKNKLFFISDFKVEAEDAPKDGVLISDADRLKYKAILEAGNQEISLVKDKIIITDKYTPEELAKREAEAIRVKLISEAKDLLRLTDRFNLSPYTESLTEIERALLNDLRAVWLSVVKSTIKVMPEIPEFIKKLLEL